MTRSLMPKDKQRPVPILVLTISLFLSLLTGCAKEKKVTAPILEGTVHYKISYSEEIEKLPFAFLLPEKMDFHFQPNRIAASFKGSLGLYSFGFISDHRNDSIITLLKVLDNKMYVVTPKEEGLFIFNYLKSAEITLNNDTVRQIAGYEAHKATVYSLSAPEMRSEVWFTPTASTKTLYNNTPFEKIPGVMLDFNLNYKNVLFKLKAQSLDTIPIPEELFTIPAEYKPTTIEEIETIISTLLK